MKHRREMKQDVDNRSLQQTRHYLAPARSLLPSQKYSSSNSQAVKHYLSPARSSGNLKAIKHYLSPARFSTSSHTASQPLGSFARMIFRTERTDTQQLHQCRASELTTRNPSSSPLAYVKVTPTDIDYNTYYRILGQKQILGHAGSHGLYFTGARGERVQVTDQLTLQNAIFFQIGQKAETILFTAEPRGKNSFL